MWQVGWEKGMSGWHPNRPLVLSAILLLRGHSGHHSRGAWGAWLALCLKRSPSCYSNTPPHATAAPGPSSAFAHTGTRARGPWGLAQVRAWGEAARARLCASGSPVGVVAHG